jgi:type I restriction enzyme S subunit
MEEKVEFYKEKEFKDTEIGEFPKDWEIKRLKDIVIKAKMGGTPRRNISEYWNGNIPFVKIEDITMSGKYLYNTEEFITEKGLENSSAWIVPKDSLLLAIYGSLGSIGINKIDVATNQAIVGIIPNNDILDIGFLYYYYLYFKPYWYKFIKKSTQPNLTLGIILDSLVPIPPLEEQKKIGEILSIIDGAIQKTDEIIDKTESLKKGLMQELFTKGIGHKEFKDTEIGRIPKEWEVKMLSEIAILDRGLSYSSKEKSKDEIPDGYLFLTLNSIGEGGGLKECGWTWIKSERLRERHFIKEGDIVIANTEQSKDGSLIGSPAIVHLPKWYKKDKAVFSHHISRLVFRINNLDVNFLFYYLSFVQPIARKYHTGTGVWGLNVDSWARDLLIPLPFLCEQQKIAEILSTVDKKLEVLKQEKVKLEKIKQWFMDELLTGKIRVRVS